MGIREKERDLLDGALRLALLVVEAPKRKMTTFCEVCGVESTI